MELTLPTKVNVTHPIMLDTKILVVIGANGAGKSSFGRDLLERYAGQAKRISGIHALFISDDESKLSASNEFARLQSMIKERLFMPRISLLHNSIKNQLWDEIEAIRPDCTFVYLTHDIDFATSRSDSKRIWIRSYDADHSVWDYELIESNESFPEEVYMEILGSRKPILFIEGTDTNSIDSKLYPFIFPDYLVKPMGGCQKVIETTKAFGQLKDFHTLDSKGIVDRDRRTQGEINYLREQHIYVPDVAEVENLLMIEDVIKTVAKRLMKDPDDVFKQVKENVVRLFQKELDSQVILHAKHQVRKKLETTVDRKITTVEQLTEHVESIRLNIHAEEIYKNIKEEFESYIETENYKSILRVYNQKGMLPQSRLCAICGISNKESYLNLILSILKENKEDAEAIRKAIKHSLGT